MVRVLHLALLLALVMVSGCFGDSQAMIRRDDTKETEDTKGIDMQQLGAMTKGYEGYEETVYPDKYGNPTVCWGHLVTPIDGLKAGQTVSREKCDTLFEGDIERAIAQSQQAFPASWSNMPREVKHVVVDMMFNLGPNRFSLFVKLNQALTTGKWEQAANEMENSDWYHEVGGRAQAHVATMRSVT